MQICSRPRVRPYDQDMATIPSTLLDVYDRWIRAERRPQERFVWRPESWRKRLGEMDLVDLDAIADACEQAGNGTRDRIDREIVRGLHSPAILRPDGGSYDPKAVVTAFVAAMIWGYGTTGYGPYRTARVLMTDTEAVQHLVDVAGYAQGESAGGVKSFEHIAGQGRNYLKYLGPAFGTKFLYFLTAASDVAETTPVMDGVIRRWFAGEPDISLVTSSWDPRSYRTYLSSLDTWRKELLAVRGGVELDRDDLEFLIFASTRRDANAWGDPFEAPTVDQLLDLLEPEIVDLDAQRGSTEGDRLLRQLADWVSGSEETS